MKGSAITGPVGKEAAELWPVSSSAQGYSYHVEGPLLTLSCSFS